MAETPANNCIQLLGKTLSGQEFAYIKEIYGDDNIFPIDVRLQLSDWIENKLVPLVPSLCADVLDSMHKQTISNILLELFEQLEERIQTIPNDIDKFIIKSKLVSVSRNLKTFANDPVGLYNIIMGKLEKEVKFIKQLSINHGLTERTTEIDNATWIRQNLSSLKQDLYQRSSKL